MMRQPPDRLRNATVYQSDAAEVYQGDALHLLPELPDGYADLIITDPPYSSGGLYRGDRSQTVSEKYSNNCALQGFTGDNRDQRSFGYWTAIWSAELLRIATAGAALLVFIDWRQLPVTADALQAGGWIYRGVIPWDKTGGRARPRPGGFRAQCEFIVWATAGPLRQWDGVPSLPGYFRCAGKRQQDRVRVAEKPAQLLRELVVLCPPDGRVLDPFAGPGSTLLAALAMGRRATGIEIEPDTAAGAGRELQAAENPQQQELFNTREGA